MQFLHQSLACQAPFMVNAYGMLQGAIVSYYFLLSNQYTCTHSMRKVLKGN